MIERISQHLAKRIMNTLKEDSTDETAVLAYGFECLINLLIPLSFFLIYSICNHIFIEMLCWLVTFLILRNQIGGYHADSHIKCIIYSILYGFVFLHLLIILPPINAYTKIIFYALFICIFAFSSPLLQRNATCQLRTINACLLFLIQCGICILLSFISSISNAIFLGSFSSVILFLIQKLKISAHK